MKQTEESISWCLSVKQSADWENNGAEMQICSMQFPAELSPGPWLVCVHLLLQICVICAHCCALLRLLRLSKVEQQLLTKLELKIHVMFSKDFLTRPITYMLQTYKIWHGTETDRCCCIVVVIKDLQSRIKTLKNKLNCLKKYVPANQTNKNFLERRKQLFSKLYEERLSKTYGFYKLNV